MLQPKAMAVVNEVRKAILGKDTIVCKVFMAILARGHILLEDNPGVGKTTLALAFSKAMGLHYNRVQFTPEIMPADVVGFSVWDRETGEFRKALHYYGVIACFIFGAAAGALLLSHVGRFMFLLAPAGLCAVFFLISSRRKLAGWRRTFRSVFRRSAGR